jgi:uncharacterized membrane protein
MGKLQDSSRIEAFSDGVFGFAVTSIILNIRVPHIGEGRDGNVLWRSLIATIVAFLLPALSILACSALWILWGRMAFVHFVPRNPKDNTKGSEIGPHEG